MNKYIILTRLQPYRNKQILLYNNQSTNDIIYTMLNAHKIYRDQYDQIAGFFWAGTKYGTAKKLFKFLKNSVPYVIEPDTKQTVRSPAAILSVPNGSFKGGDCKHYSQFIGGVLSGLNRKGAKIDWCYRFANYRLFGTTPHHVFCVIKTNNGEIWIDPVLNSFNYKKPYVNKIDKTI